MTDLKLEVLKLIHRHDVEPEQLIARGNKLVNWLQDKPEAPPRAGSKAKATTVDPLG